MHGHAVGRTARSAPRAQDYGQLIRTHRESGADITICTNSVDWAMAPRRGLVRINPDTGARAAAADQGRPRAGACRRRVGFMVGPLLSLFTISAEAERQ